MAKRKKKNKAEMAQKNKDAQKKFFTVTLIITVILIALLYLSYRSMF